MNTSKIKKWDMLLLILCILFFVLFITSSIHLTNKKNSRVAQSQTEIHEMKFKLIELRDLLSNIARGDEFSISPLNAKIVDLKTNYNLPQNLKQSVDDAENLSMITITRLKNSALFFKKDEIITLFQESAKRAESLQKSTVGDNVALSEYIESNQDLGLVSNLLYSGNTQAINEAFKYIETILDHEEKIATQLNHYPEAKAIHEATSTFMGLVRNKKDILRLVDTANRFYIQTPTLMKRLDEAVRDGSHTVRALEGGLPDSFILAGYLIATLFLILMILIIYRTLKERTLNNRQVEVQNLNNKEAILEMLNVMKQLSEGNLTVKALVSDPLTSTLANSFNLSVEELKSLVSAVNRSADKVTEAVKDTTNLVDRSTDASLLQATQITEATETVSHVTQAMLDVSAQTSAAVDIATSSTDVARSGSERVRSTITGMDQIREHIQETSKRIKRLGESSQEIGDIVELINDIADQTHILALNAAIQASAAGEAGKGFAVVADEVQRLAERTGNATQRVESLVKTIQTDTHEAIFAMEKSTSEVVNGANLAERAGESLNEIESVSGHLASLIQNVSQASREVSELGTKVKTSMESIRKLSEQNVENTKSTKSSVEGLLGLANELKSSVTGFKIN